MTRPIQRLSPTDKFVTMAFLVAPGTVGGTYTDLTFNDGSIDYFGTTLKQSFKYTLIDVVGGGSVRVCYNKPGYILSQPIKGAKTLNSGDSLYIEEDVWHVRIYFIGPSTVELILKSDKELGWGQ
ncbi:MAG TPA: hypothetical protein P5136_02760 [Methanofastidiosum sp.]|nr:hypothetical protein [Methanofastidiosum sp.]